jgi:hypothetical protein
MGSVPGVETCGRFGSATVLRHRDPQARHRRMGTAAGDRSASPSHAGMPTAAPPVMMPPVSTTSRSREDRRYVKSTSMMDCPCLLVSGRLLAVPGLPRPIWGERLVLQVQVDRSGWRTRSDPRPCRTTSDALDVGLLHFRGAHIALVVSSTPRDRLPHPSYPVEHDTGNVTQVPSQA